MRKIFSQFIHLSVILLFAISCVTLSGCKKTQDMQIACSFKSAEATTATIHSTLTPATAATAVQLSIFHGDTLIDKLNRTHNGDNDFTFTGLRPNTAYTVEIKIINDPSIKAQPCTTSVQTIISNTPIVHTSASVNLTSNGADVGGVVSFDGLNPVIESGVCWSTSANPSVLGTHISLSSGVGSFTSTLTGLNPLTKYHVRAYATTSFNVFYGEDSTFTTLAIIPTPPTVITAIPSTVTQNAATTGGNVTNSGTANVTARGICLGLVANPDITGNKTIDGTGTGVFVTNLSGLLPGTTYHVRAYATNSVGTSYGADETFTTLAPSLPTVITTTTSAVAQTTATAGGNVTSDGGAIITALGVCYGIATNPDLSGSFTNNGAGTGGFTSPLTGLTANTTYYVRAYATNSVGTAYGAEVTFTTLP